MNAIKFIQQHGVKRAKECLPAYEKHYCGLERLFVEDLKRLVESVDLIDSYGGVGLLEYQVRCLGQEMSDALKQAIADYESIYGGEHV